MGGFIPNFIIPYIHCPAIVGGFRIGCIKINCQSVHGGLQVVSDALIIVNI